MAILRQLQGITVLLMVALPAMAAGGSSSNIAPLSTVSASSENVIARQNAAKAVDGVISGFPMDASKEWATMGGKVGTWIRLDWAAPNTVDHMVLYDRPNFSDQIAGGMLLFSDGSSVSVGALPNNGAGLTVTFAPRSVTWIKFTVDAVSSFTRSVGLAEWEVYGVAASLQGGGSGNTNSPSAAQSDPPPKSVVSPRQLFTSGVTASAYDLTQGLVPSNAVDGSLQTAWGVSSMPQSLVMDLGSQQVLSNIKMLISAAQGGADISYSLQTSLDNQVWTQLFSGNALSSEPQWTAANFDPVYARYVRVNLGSSNSVTAAKIYEIIPYGRNIRANASAPVNDAVTLSWKPNPEIVDGYLIYFGGNADVVDTQATKVITVSTPGFDPRAPAVRYDSWYDFGLLPGDNVCFKVRAYNADGVSEFSPAVCSIIAIPQ